MSDTQSQSNKDVPDVPEWFLTERPVILGELYFLEDDRCEVERAGRNADVDLVVQLKEDPRNTSAGVIIRGDILSEEHGGDDPPEQRSFALSSLKLPDSTRRQEPVIVLFFDMTTDEGYGQILPLNGSLSTQAKENGIPFINLQDVQPSSLIRAVLDHSSEPEPGHGELPSIAFLRAVTLNRKGALLLSRGKYDAALDIFTRVLKSTPRAEQPKLWALTLSNLAQVHHARGELSQAEELYDEALSLMADIETRTPESQPSTGQYSTLLDI